MKIDLIEDAKSAGTVHHDVALTARLRSMLAMLFSVIFMVLSVSFAVVSIKEFLSAISDFDTLTSGLVASVNAAVISLAAFELGFNVGKEYINESDEDIFAVVRRSIARFVGVVCIALVLEGLIMVIKYSQLDMAGNLGYPVAIIGSASLLLVALGLFLYLTRVTAPSESERIALLQSGGAASRKSEEDEPVRAVEPVQQMAPQ